MSTAVEALEEEPLPAAQVPAEPAAVDTTIDSLILNGKKLRVDIADAIRDAKIRLSIEGASELVLVLYDPKLEILNSGILTSRCDIEVDGDAFRLVKFSKTGRELTLTFEDREVAILRSYKKPRRAFRDKVTRARFARMLVREAKTVGFYSPELNKQQPIAQPETQKRKAIRLDPGFSRNERITVKGREATGEQRRNLERVLDVGYKMRMPRRVMIAAVATVTQESAARNLAGGDRDSVGLFQQRPSQGWGTEKQCRNPEHAAGKFFDKAIIAYRDKPGRSIADLCQAVQRSAFPSAYAQWVTEATKTVDRYLGGTSRGSARQEKVVVTRYAFSRGKPGGPAGEDTWSCLKRLASEVGWRVFMRRGTVFFVSEPQLFKTRPAATITPETLSVDDVDFDHDSGKQVAEARLTVLVARWEAAPGTIVVLDGYGPADGRWIVSESDRSLFSETTSITLRKPQPRLPEPAPETETVSIAPSRTEADADPAIPSAIRKAYSKARAISAKKYPYVWGGGHGSSFAPTGGGYDCSGAVSAVLGAAGKLSSPLTSGGLESWGASGEGKYLTVWTNDKHVFIEFKYPGKGREHFGTGDWGKGHRGAGFNPRMHPKSGFTPRHIRGM